MIKGTIHIHVEAVGKRPPVPIPSGLLSSLVTAGTSMYASFLGISKALHLDGFYQPLGKRFFDSLEISTNYLSFGVSIITMKHGRWRAECETIKAKTEREGG